VVVQPAISQDVILHFLDRKISADIIKTCIYRGFLANSQTKVVPQPFLESYDWRLTFPRSISKVIPSSHNNQDPFTNLVSGAVEPSAKEKSKQMPTSPVDMKFTPEKQSNASFPALPYSNYPQECQGSTAPWSSSNTAAAISRYGHLANAMTISPTQSPENLVTTKHPYSLQSREESYEQQDSSPNMYCQYYQGENYSGGLCLNLSPPRLCPGCGQIHWESRKRKCLDERVGWYGYVRNWVVLLCTIWWMIGGVLNARMAIL
jgi:hypothetical protein